MSVDRYKKEFIEYMEDVHRDLLFLKNYVGCMIAIFVEQKPITQDRIMEITGYSRSTVSQTLNLLLNDRKVNRIKLPKIRKKFYTIKMSPREFMLDFFNDILNVFNERIKLIKPLVEEVEPFENTHERFSRLYNFLSNFYQTYQDIVGLHFKTSQELQELVLKGSYSNSDLNISKAESSEYQKHLNEFLKPVQIPIVESVKPFKSEEQNILYSEFKSRFMQKYLANTTQFQSAITRSIIQIEMLIENKLYTQEELEKTTGLARSLISTALSTSEKYGTVQVTKKPRDRKKYYSISMSWEMGGVNRLRLSQKYARDAYKMIKKIAENVREIDDEGTESYLKLLEDVLHSFEQFEFYYKLLEIEYVEIKIAKEEKN